MSLTSVKSICEYLEVSGCVCVKCAHQTKFKCSTNENNQAAWGSSEGLSQVSSAVKDREGEAEHRFMQNMTRLPSYFTLALSRVTRTGMGRRRSKEPSLDQKFYAPTLSTVPTRSGGSFLEQQMPWLHLVHLIQLACLVHS